jgi:hypothetical protein
MNKDQIVFVGAAFVFIALIALAAQFKWLPDGRRKTVLIFIAGTATALSLWLADMPPAWFSASRTGFGMTLFFLLSSIVGKTREETSFGMPLMLGMGLTMLVANVLRLVKDHGL